MPVRQLLLTLRSEAAQASFEYMLVIGGPAILLMALLLLAPPPADFVHQIVRFLLGNGAACLAIDPVGTAAGATCIAT